MRRSRRAGPVFDLLTALAVLAGSLVGFAVPASAQIIEPVVSGGGTQCRNGGGSPLAPTPCLNGALGGTSFAGWSGGAANSSSAHWAEGDFVSYRATLAGVAAGTFTLRLTYITVSSSKHAIDYLGSFDATETTSPAATSVHANNNNPCFDALGSAAGSGCTAPGTPPTPASTFPVPPANLAGQRTCGGASGLTTVPTQEPGVFSLFAPTAAGATLTGASFVSQNVVSGSTTCSTTIDVSFSVSGPGTYPVVLAWGGRIASALDWGDGNSASAISGSPYHMTIVGLNGSPAVSGELALSAAAVAGPPAAATQLSSATITAGNTLTDVAVLTGSRGTVTGTVQFTLCSGTTTGCPQAIGTDIGSPVNLVNGSATSAAFGANLAPGNYCVGIEYVNDGHSFYSGFFADGQLNECFTVTTAAPVLGTALSQDSIVVGGSVHDTATLHSATANASGTVQYRHYNSLSGCETDTAAFPGTAPTGGTPAGTVTVASGAVPNSSTVSFPGTGTFFWAAFYSGDSNNDPAASECVTEALVVRPASPAVTTALSADVIVVGTQAHDTATLPGATATAGGTVQYRHYSSLAACEADTDAFPGTPPTGGTPAGTVTVTDAAVPDSNTVTFPNAGTFFWAAFYSGDPDNDPAASGCVTEALVVSPTVPPLITELSEATIAASGSVHDTATLVGATATAEGTLEYRYYATVAACDTDTGAFPATTPTGGTSAGQVTVTNATVPNSDTVTFPNAGTFFWAAFYSGDADNAAAASACVTEALVVQPATPAVSTALFSFPIPVDGSAHDTAQLHDATATAGGSLEYRRYNSVASCEADTDAFPGTDPSRGASAGTVTVTDATVPPSDTVSFPDAGTFFWAAFYSGDPNNAAATSDCVSEAAVVTPLAPAVDTTLSSVPILAGGSVHDSAVLRGASANAGGTLEYRHYGSLEACESDTAAFPDTSPTGGTSAGTVTVTDGTVPNSDTVTFPTFGTFVWAAFYSGDSNNVAAASDCATEVLGVRAVPTLTTQLFARALVAGGTNFDTATLHDATPTASGEVQYRFYPSLASCDADTARWPTSRDPTWPTGGTFAGMANVVDGVVPPSDVIVTFPGAGTFFWAAFYSGDADNAAAASVCATEPLVVAGTLELTVEKTVDRQVASVSDRLTYTITVTNHGTGAATALTVADLLPSGVALVSADTHGIGVFDPSTGDWSIPLLPAGTTATLTLVATVLPSAAGSTLTNQVTVTVPEGTPPPTIINPCPDDPTRSCATTVVTATPPLPETGSPAAQLGALAACLIAVGSAMLLIARRRQQN